MEQTNNADAADQPQSHSRLPFRSKLGLACVSVVILLLAAIPGCSRGAVAVKFKKQSGDLVEFIDQELRRHGGTPGTNQPKPVMQAEWQYAEGNDGFQILIA